jgi:uncharacterized protein (TIGR03437 family)
VLPGIFAGAVLKANTAINATTTAVAAGDYIEIYCTGLGTTTRSGSIDTTVLTPVVFIGATPVRPVFSGLAPGYRGLYQVNVQIPSGLAAGMQPLSISIGQMQSNEIRIAVQ